VLEAVFRDGAGKETLDSPKTAAARPNNKHDRLVDLDLV